MKITFQLGPDDLGATNRLTMRPRKWLAVTGYCLLALMGVVTIFWGYEWFSTGVVNKDFLLMVGVVTYLGLIIFVWVPWRAKRLYRQQKSLHYPVSAEFSEEAFSTETANGQARIKWGDYHKWKANDQVILLYHSDAMCNVIPCRAFSDAAERQAALALIERHLGPQKV